MAWASELPAELLCRPVGLVVLTGLDTTYNAVHKAVWDSFCNNRRPDRVPLHFRSLGADHVYPKCKSKRTSYEWYIPKGILKTGWMKKHLYEIPAVVVIFFDLDWDEPLWKERQMECSTRVEIVRNSLQGRGTKIAVVLLQKTAPLPPGEDVVAAERAATFCSACDISAKSLYVLPQTDHLLGYTIRLENAFYELAQSYYHTEARKVKSHKDFLNKTTHQLLFVRHQFKTAFFNELKQDTHTALKHYKQAYGHILEQRMHDTNMLEIKTIAGFVNYKICRLSFQHNVPLDAIAQFRKHIDFFKNRAGIPELAFEHSAWMSRQFQVFGDLFDEAIKLGLTAIQTQHPGFYYQQAANHAIFRKQLCHGLCVEQEGKVQHSILDGLESLDFYGQRPWRQGHQSIEPPDVHREKEGIAALQALERKVDHSWMVIPLLSSAVAQFRKYKSPRMKRYLMVQMGEEYFHAKDYGKALMLLNKVMWDYRAERWWPLLTAILETSLKCAYLTARVQEYVSNCMELIGEHSQCTQDKKARIQLNLIQVLSHETPSSEPGLDQSCVEQAARLWGELKSHPSVFTIEMQGLIPFVECKARFVNEVVAADAEVELEVCLKVTSPLSVQFTKLNLQFSNQVYNQYCEVVDNHDTTAASASKDECNSDDLHLEPGHPRLYHFSFLPSKEDVGGQIEISSITLEMGSENGCCATLRWIGAGVGEIVGRPPLVPRSSRKASGGSLNWDTFQSFPTIRVTPRQAQVELVLDHQPPCLLNEFYSISVTVTNIEVTDIHATRLSLGLHQGVDTADSATHISVENPDFDGKIHSKRIEVDIGTLKKGEKVTQRFFIKCLQSGTRTFSVKVDYNIDAKMQRQTVSCACHKEETISINTVTPFEVSLRLESLKFEAVEAVHAEEPFLLMTEIRCTAPWPVEIKASSILLNQFIKTASDVFESQLEGVKLNRQECGAECLCLVAAACVQPSVAMGTYTLHWRRQGEDLPYVTSTFSLPVVNIEHIPIAVHLQLPAFGRVKTLLPLTYTIRNRTPYVQELEVNMESTDNFMFSGNKQTRFRVLPSEEHQLLYNFFPLVAGQVVLPRLHVNMLRYPGTMDDLVHSMLPSHIFIRPSGQRRALAGGNSHAGL
ncbi:trafficking protein particle complex subunit 11-like isoform X1 [Pomacea canaliculata]|uniref:trafficking protein particle complex subunit 11-like isoform X1 n=1 Tax=Pomacea canaliculata TaxID=400727 RepID=UPI000D731616|nr:trafficking protein particle complex subunit 11-like isoform X1 [Pomacea canaliculata]